MPKTSYVVLCCVRKEMSKIQDFLEGASSFTGIPVSDLYCTQNGKKVTRDDDIQGEGPLRWFVRLVGGKGGFGSMLRAIGAQIEKTTNREACRDLSGRRLRDIREERRLREWAAQRQEREQEAERKREEKLKKLSATPKFQFKDEAYEKARSNLEESVDEAVEKGFQAASVSNPQPRPAKRKPAKLWIDDGMSDLSSDESETENSSHDSSESAATETDKSEQVPNKRVKLSNTTSSCTPIETS